MQKAWRTPGTGTPADPVNVDDGTLRFGTGEWDGTERGFDGVLDEVRLFDAVLTATELDELRALGGRFPSAEIQLHIAEGMRLSELKDQDSYSYEIAVIFLGGDTQKELLQKYRAVQQALPLELAPVQPTSQ